MRRLGVEGVLARIPADAPLPADLDLVPVDRPNSIALRMAMVAADEADLVQFFLGDPQSWRKPPPRPDAELLRRSPIPIYIHAPYLINVASANNRIRIPSRKILQDTCDGAAAINATAVIVHGGHADDHDEEAGFDRWVKALNALDSDVPVYLENTAGGTHAMARHFDTIAKLWGLNPVSYPCLIGHSYDEAVSRAYPLVTRTGDPHYDHIYAAMAFSALVEALKGAFRFDPARHRLMLEGGEWRSGASRIGPFMTSPWPRPRAPRRSRADAPPSTAWRSGRNGPARSRRTAGFHRTGASAGPWARQRSS